MSVELETCGVCYALTDDYFSHAQWHQDNQSLELHLQGQIDGIAETIIEHQPDWFRFIKGEN